MVKIAILSDFHFGFGWNTDRKEDSFIQAQEAIYKALEKESDLIVLPGDLFDSRNPGQEILSKSMEVLSKPLSKKSNTKIIKTLNKKLIKNSKTSSSTPIIAIYGTHERRGKHLVNPVQLLEKAGFLTFLHKNTIVLNVNGEKVAIHGLSGVPERYAKKELEEWKPKPLPNTFNIFVFHQSLENYILSNHPILNIKDLPKDFDLYVDGHIHSQNRTSYSNSPFLFPGSTIRTQLAEEEKNPKGFYLLTIENQKIKKIQFIKLKTPRDFFYKKLEFKKAKPSQIEKKVENTVEHFLNLKKKEKKPLIRILIKGTLESGKPIDVDLSYIRNRFNEKALLSIGKDLEGETSKKVKLLRDLRSEKISIKEMGFRVLKDYLKKLGYEDTVDLKELYGLLSDEKVDEALKLIYSNMKKDKMKEKKEEPDKTEKESEKPKKTKESEESEEPEEDKEEQSTLQNTEEKKEEEELEPTDFRFEKGTLESWMK